MIELALTWVLVYCVWKFWQGNKLVREIERLMDENEKLRRRR